jgi:hypothetical protein
VHTLVADGVALVEELLARNGTGRRTSILEPFKPHLHRRWNEGCTNATTLFAEITARGYRGGQNIVRQYLHQFRAAVHIPRPPRKPPSVRRAVSWIMTDPEHMTTVDQQKLDAILAASPHLTSLAGHATSRPCRLGPRFCETWCTRSLVASHCRTSVRI